MSNVRADEQKQRHKEYRCASNHKKVVRYFYIRRKYRVSDDRVTFTVSTIHDIHYAGDSILEAIRFSREHGVSYVDVWRDGKKIGNVYVFHDA